jgi:hypothetical protein
MGGGTERRNSLAKIAKCAKKNSEIFTFRTLAILAILARVISGLRTIRADSWFHLAAMRACDWRRA